MDHSCGVFATGTTTRSHIWNRGIILCYPGLGFPDDKKTGGQWCGMLGAKLRPTSRSCKECVWIWNIDLPGITALLASFLTMGTSHPHLSSFLPLSRSPNPIPIPILHPFTKFHIHINLIPSTPTVNLHPIPASSISFMILILILILVMLMLKVSSLIRSGIVFILFLFVLGIVV